MGTNIVPNIESRTHLGRKIATSSAVDSRKTAFLAACAAESKKAISTVVLDVAKVTLIADYFVFTGGDSRAQVKAIVEEILSSLEKVGRKAKSVEGLTEGRWVLIDFGDVIIHVLQGAEREYYKLEQFWNHALIVDPEEWTKTGSDSDNLEVE
ncbi:MAG: ribosome silencing factor [Cyanobacteria bacterium HKST-UBA01]|nr:ribosome silencing factor [Cyanobacteria bacterium HKST-UBA01]